MPSTSRLIDKVAVLLGALWVCFALLLAVELAGHVVNGTSDGGAELLRAFEILILLVGAAGVLFRFAGWRWVVVVPCVLIAIRDYFFLMVPLELHWGFDQIVAAVRLALVVATVALATLWGRFGVRDTERKVIAT